jgi:hypothetical protein
MTSTATVSTAGAAGRFIRRTSFRAAFFTGARLGLALATARFAAAFPRAALALGRAVAAFLLWTFDDCFLRLAMIDPCWRSAKRIDARMYAPAEHLR